MKTLLCALIILLSLTIFPFAGATEVILYSSFESGAWDLWMMRPDGSGKKRITQTSRDAKAPALSPDGARIVFHDNRGRILVCGFDGVTTEVLYQPEGFNSHASWTPDSRGILHICRPSGKSESTGCFVSRFDPADAVSPIILVEPDTAHHFPSFSPDGLMMVYSRFDPERRDMTARFPLIEEIFTLDIRTGQVSQRTRLGCNSTHPRWSPDGTRIIFSSNAEGSYDLWTLDVANPDAPPSRLTSDPGFEGFPSWSPDGSRIAFVSSRTGGMEIWTMNADGEEWMPLTQSSEGRDSMEPFWGRIP